MKRTAQFRSIVSAAVIIAAIACGDSTTDVDSSILLGLSRAEANDTVTTTPPPPTQPTPGAFHGFVLGPGTGPDTMATAPRLQGVAVMAYPLLGYSGTQPQVGDVVASMVTDANGAFQSPTIAGGEYVVTFVPPLNSIYRGVYVTTTIHDGSSSGTWWIILPRK